MHTSLSQAVTSTIARNLTNPSPTRQRFPRQTGQLSLRQMEALGFQIAGEIDRYFILVDLPPGWYKAPDGFQRGWFMICDDQDRLRCQCIEGSRTVHGVMATWQRRYEPDVQWELTRPYRQRWRVLDGGDILTAGPWVDNRPPHTAETTLALYREAVAWCNTYFPSWRHLDAYWACGAIPPQ